MKKTQLKATGKIIKKELVSYLSILLIALLTVSAYLGVNFAAASLRNEADDFYAKHNFRDIEITSTMLLSQEDMDAIGSAEGVKDIEGVYAVSGSLEYKGGRVDADVVSLSERINTVELKGGRLPQSANECVLEKEFMDRLSLYVGDTINITDVKGKALSYLKGSKFVITGSVIHPDHIAYSDHVQGNRYVLVGKEAFDTEILEGCYMKAEIKAEGTKGLSIFSKKYENIIKSLKDRLEPLNDELESSREATVKNRMQAKIEEGQEKLDDGAKRLDESRKLLDESAKKIADSEKELSEAKKQLDDEAKQLADEQAELDGTQKALEESQKQLEESRQQLGAGQAELNAAYLRLSNNKQQLAAKEKELDGESAQLDEANAQLVKGYNETEDKKTGIRNMLRQVVANVIGAQKADQINWAASSRISNADDPALPEKTGQFEVLSGVVLELTSLSISRVEGVIGDALKAIGEEASYSEVKAGLENSTVPKELERLNNDVLAKKSQFKGDQEQYIAELAIYKEKLAEYEKGVAEYEAGYAQYDAAMAEYNKKGALYAQELTQYNDGLAQYEEEQATLKQKQAEYDDSLKKYNSRLKKLEDSKKELEEGEENYQEKTREYEKGLEDLEDAKEQLAGLSSCYFVILDNSDNGGFSNIRLSADKLRNISIIFALLFVIALALVIYVCMRRIIGRQWTQVEDQKALGLLGSEDFFKYLAFGISATLAGTLLGTLVGCFVVQSICLGSNSRFYVIEQMHSTFGPVWFVLVILAGILLSGLAVWVAGISVLRQNQRMVKDL